MAFDLLASEGRRIALSYLLESDDGVAVHELTNHVDGARTATSDDRRASPGRTARRFHHEHFPKLLGAGVVEYDDERGRLTATPRLEQLRPFVDLAREHQQS